MSAKKKHRIMMQAHQSSTREAHGVPVMLNQYDAVRYSDQRRRRQQDKGREERTLKPVDRMYSITLGRDMHRNNVKVVSMEDMLKRYVGGVCKAQVNTDENPAWGKAATDYFNKVFMRDCSRMMPRTHFVQVLEKIITAMIREGDILVVFDDESGKLLFYEADQLCRMNDTDFRAYAPAGWIQSDGCVLDETGALRGWIAGCLNAADRENHLTTMSVLPYEQCMLVDAEDGVLISNTYRVNQLRGVSELLPVSIILDDSHDMLEAETVTAKTAARDYVTVYNGEETAASEADRGLLNREIEMYQASIQGGTAGSGTESGDTVRIIEKERYDELDSAQSAIVTYAQQGDRIEHYDPKRPNTNLFQYYKDCNALAASALGITQGYGEQRVTNSYTAHRGETCMMQENVRDRQKYLEHTYLDWVIVKVLRWAMARGRLRRDAPSGWELQISWRMNRLPDVDENAAINSKTAALKAGLTTYREQLGPDWMEQLEESGREFAFIREHNLPLSTLETASGQIVNETTTNNQEGDADNANQ